MLQGAFKYIETHFSCNGEKKKSNGGTQIMPLHISILTCWTLLQCPVLLSIVFVWRIILSIIDHHHAPVGQHYPRVLSVLVSLIFNQFLVTTPLPNDSCVDMIILIFKSGDTSVPPNYRPIHELADLVSFMSIL